MNDSLRLRFFEWKEPGFDAAVLQPNHFFTKTDDSRITKAADYAKQYPIR